MTHRHWTDDEVKTLTTMLAEAENDNDITMSDICEAVGRSRASVEKKLVTTGLKVWLPERMHRKRKNRSDDPKVVDGFRLIPYAGAPK